MTARRTTYAFLAVAGTAIPYWHFIPWVLDHGIAPSAMFAELWSTRIGAFFGADVLISGVALVFFLVMDGKKTVGRLWWLPVVGTLTVGVSLGLPLFLYLRELRGGGEDARNHDAAPIRRRINSPPTSAA